MPLAGRPAGCERPGNAEIPGGARNRGRVPPRGFGRHLGRLRGENGTCHDEKKDLPASVENRTSRRRPDLARLLLSVRAGCLHGYQAVAPLKRGNEFGPASAMHGSPLLPSRGPIQAGRDSGSPGRAGGLHGYQAVAPLKPAVRPAVPDGALGLHGYQAVAPLKQAQACRLSPASQSSPRLPSRGPIEASLPTARRLRGRRSPRLPSRGPIEAPGLRQPRSAPPERLHGYQAVAPLKLGGQRLRGAGVPRLHGYQAVAPLKRLGLPLADKPQRHVSTATTPWPH